MDITISEYDANAIADARLAGYFPDVNGAVVSIDVVQHLADAIVEARTHDHDDDEHVATSLRCACGDPTAPYVIHRVGVPCYVADDDPHNECRVYAAELKHTLRGDG